MNEKMKAWLMCVSPEKVVLAGTGIAIITSLTLAGTAIALFVIVVAILAILASAMQGIFVTALYTYAKTGTVPSSFDKDLIQNAFAPKPPQPGNI